MEPNFSYNQYFKAPKSPRRRFRSPTPPRAFVEPLTPPKPAPVEPVFNYPALPRIAATPKPRAASLNDKSGHKRTPSSIDALAEAALAGTSGYQTHSSRQSSGHYAQYGQTHPAYGASEPPHKRSRSELFPSPQLGAGAYVSRPSTSSGFTHGLPAHYGYSSQPAHTYERRVEDAALLLNFKTGNGMSPPQAPPPQPYRPHANSFPQDVHHQRPADASMRAHLLPPFRMQEAQRHGATLPSPQRTTDSDPSPTIPLKDSEDDVVMTDAHPVYDIHIGKTEPQQTRTPPEEASSRAQSTDVAPSESSDASKSRGGKSKGRPKGANSRKSMAEKAASKRSSTRKKTTGVTKTNRAADELQPVVEKRRKSFGGFNGSGGHDEGSRSTTVPPEVLMTIKYPSQAGDKAKVASETVCAGCLTVRENAITSSEMDEWISCNGCKKWFHIDCAGFKKAHEIRDVDKYFCPACEPTHGKTTYVRKSARAHAQVDYAELQRGVLKTSEESMEHHYINGIKDETLFPFDQELFPRMRPEMVTREFLERSGMFTEPICIPAEWNPRPWLEKADSKASESTTGEAEGFGMTLDVLGAEDFEYDAVRDDGQDKLDMVMPEDLTVRQVCNLVGPDMPLDVIDVKTQNSGAKWNLGRWADYYEEKGDDKPIRNVISLEVSQTKLGRILRRPKVVRDIDLQDAVWPQEEIDKGKWPKVQYYCLMSIADSYTDFHIDFGGSSVYYHILKGKKTFFFIPPKQKHLKAYEEWNESPQQNYTFLPNVTKECYRVDLSEGDTMLIPSGWIHAVWTPETSLVIGGNFLTRMSFKNQFKVVDIEKANHTPMKFRYPFFQRIMWYTTLQYLKEDPLPPEVSQMFYEGGTYPRDRQIWEDFDGDLAAADGRQSAHNARYYSQQELEGLPDLVNYIFWTVMAVKGLVEGVTADQQKRMNTGIPKGHGEPLEIAKTFAQWVAWKRGNEEIPAWAHPMRILILTPRLALLTSIKDEKEGTKKLSARALRDLERKEAIAAWKVAPDRQSERQLARNAAAAAPSSVAPLAPSKDQMATATSSQHAIHQEQPFTHQDASPSATPMAFMMESIPGQHISTPKTSVLGPKRVACDACRRRRIRCKHKDQVVQAEAPADLKYANGLSFFQSNLAPELHDTIAVTPRPNGIQPNGHGPLPGTNAYVSANIPMTMNGVPIFGEMPKRGRSKACFECRKSKRRCVHDESGNVDPLKAIESPIPRGSAAKKRASEDNVNGEGHLMVIKKQKPNNTGVPPPNHAGGQAGVLMPQTVSPGPSRQAQRSESSRPTPVINEPSPEPTSQQPEIDPNLFTYPEPEQQTQYSNHTYPYPSGQPQQPGPYGEFPSLEQIANEVLDMNGRSHEDYIDAQLNAPLPQHVQYPYHSAHVYPSHETAHLRAKAPKPDGSVDSAVSLPNGDSSDGSVDDRLRNALTADSFHMPDGVGDGQSANHTQGQSDKVPNGNAGEIPLYKPPPRPSQSPEMKKHQPASLVDGTASAPEAKTMKADGKQKQAASIPSTA